MSRADPRRLLEELPDSALLPVSFVRQILIEQEDGGETATDRTVEQAGQILGRQPSTIRAWCNRGLLEGAYRLRGRQWRIPRSAIDALQRAEAERHAAKISSATSNRPSRTVDLGAWRKSAR